MERRHADVLLVGGGVAAARCSRALRRGGFRGSIVLVGEESSPPYNRPPLSKELLRGVVSDELVLAEPPAWYARRGVDLLLGTPTASLDPGERVVELTDGTRLHFGKLLLATGAAPRRPRVPGQERALLLRTLPDAVAIRDRAAAGARGAVVGGGFIGVEVAASLAARGVRVTLLERGEALWAGALGPEISAWASERLAAAGVTVRFGVEVTEFEADAVLIGDERMAVDLVVAGVGVAPRVELAAHAGLRVDDGVVVDERQATSDPAVWAAGDVARPAGAPRVEHWHAARESGERAARAMLGEPVPARRAPWIYSEFAGANLDVVGDALAGDEQVAMRGVRAWVRRGRVAQVAILDGAVPVEDARELVEREGTPTELAALAPRA